MNKMIEQILHNQTTILVCLSEMNKDLEIAYAIKDRIKESAFFWIDDVESKIQEQIKKSVRETKETRT